MEFYDAAHISPVEIMPVSELINTVEKYSR